MKLHSVITKGVNPQILFEIKRLSAKIKQDSTLQAILEYVDSQTSLLRQYGFNPDTRNIPGHVRIGLHNHFPKTSGWYNWYTGNFNPKKLPEFAQAARIQGFDIVSLSNYSDDSVFSGNPGIKFEFKEGKIIVLRSQECLELGDIQPVGYTGNLDMGNLERAIDSTIAQGGFVLFPHPANQAYRGAGEELVARHRQKIVIETQNILANFPWFFRFADMVAKEWSLKYEIPGVSGVDSHNLYMSGGFYVRNSLLDLTSPESIVAGLVNLIELRRSEMHASNSLISGLIINTEDYPNFWNPLVRELVPQIKTSYEYGKRNYLGKS